MKIDDQVVLNKKVLFVHDDEIENVPLAKVMASAKKMMKLYDEAFKELAK